MDRHKKISCAPQNRRNPTLTIRSYRDKIENTREYADVVELVDSVDLGDVTSVKVFFRRPHRKIKQAGMTELADMQDLSDVTLGKVFREVFL